MSLLKYVNIRTHAYDTKFADDERCELTGRECYMLVIDEPSMDGCDCIVAYVFDSVEELTSELGLSMDDIEDNVADYMLALPEGKVYYGTWEEKNVLRPVDMKSATAVLQAGTRELERAMKNPVKTAWYYDVHMPYMYERYGRIVANCLDFVG